MAFYDIDLEKKIESNHELRKINECIDFSSVAYRVNSGKSELGRHEYGLDCGLKCLFSVRINKPDLGAKESESFGLDTRAILGSI